MQSRISADEIPVPQIDVALTDAAASWLITDAHDVDSAMGGVAYHWNGLKWVYTAPESGQVCAALEPAVACVKDFSSDLHSVGAALAAFAEDASGPANVLARTKKSAQAFRDRTAGNHAWAQDPNLVAENNFYNAEVRAALVQYQEAERTCANAIEALFSGKQLSPITGPNDHNGYGFSAIPPSATMPWGAPATVHKSWFAAAGDALRYFNLADLPAQLRVASGAWQGLVGMWSGLGDLSGLHGMSRFGQSWLGVSSLASQDPSKRLNAWKDFGKGLVGWDDWSTDPAKAMGQTAFNVGTMFIPVADVLGAAGDALKGATAAADGAGDLGSAIGATMKIAADVVVTVGKVAIDPVAAAIRGLPRVRDLLADIDVVGLGHAPTEPAIALPIGRLPAHHEMSVPIRHEATAPVHHEARAPSTGDTHPRHAGHEPAQHDGEVRHGPAQHEPVQHDGDGGGSGDHGSVDHLPASDHGSDITPGRGNLPDGSWEGPNGLHLSATDNAAVESYLRDVQGKEPHITHAMQAISHDLPRGRVLGLDHRMKGPDSLKRKISTEQIQLPNVKASDILPTFKDAVRYSFEIENGRYTSDVYDAIDRLRDRGMTYVSSANSWDAAGYRGLNSAWKDSATGLTYEIQVHTAESFDAKMVTHPWYEAARLPGVSVAERARLNDLQNRVFSRVRVPQGAEEINISKYIGGHG